MINIIRQTFIVRGEQFQLDFGTHFIELCDVDDGYVITEVSDPKDIDILIKDLTELKEAWIKIQQNDGITT
jgi:hypothetical protein